jgi:hypothetical protein
MGGGRTGASVTAPLMGEPELHVNLLGANAPIVLIGRSSECDVAHIRARHTNFGYSVIPPSTNSVVPVT